MTSLSKLEYLKRYGCDSSNISVKKKRKKFKIFKNNIKILDSDIKFKDDGTLHSSDDDKFDLLEEKPTLFASDGATLFTDEYQRKEQQKQDRWAPVAGKQAPNTKLSSRKRHDSSSNDEQTNNKQRKVLLKPEKFQQKKEKRREARHDSSDSDLSPSRKQSNNINKSKTRHDSSDSDLSPDRSRKVICGNDFDLSSPRGRGGNDSDLSPDRTKGARDLSPQRRRNEGTSSNWDRKSVPKREVKAEVVKSGGLKSASELRTDNDLRRREKQLKMASLQPEASGRGAETIYRDRKSGKKVDLKLEELKKRKAEEENAKENEKFSVWGKGVTQTESYEKKLADDVHEMHKPLARYKDDKDLDVMLKNEMRAEDPMLAFLRKKNNDTSSKNLAERPRYKGPAPPVNRFNIWPGYRWDGVNRSNGFETKRFAAISDKQTFEHEKFKWSSEAL